MSHKCIKVSCDEIISDGVNWCIPHGTIELRRRIANQNDMKYSSRPLM